MNHYISYKTNNQATYLGSLGTMACQFVKNANQIALNVYRDMCLRLKNINQKPLHNLFKNSIVYFFFSSLENNRIYSAVIFTWSACI